MELSSELSVDGLHGCHGCHDAIISAGILFRLIVNDSTYFGWSLAAGEETVSRLQVFCWVLHQPHHRLVDFDFDYVSAQSVVGPWGIARQRNRCPRRIESPKWRLSFFFPLAPSVLIRKFHAMLLHTYIDLMKILNRVCSSTGCSIQKRIDSSRANKYRRIISRIAVRSY